MKFSVEEIVKLDLKELRKQTNEFVIQLGKQMTVVK